MLHIMAIPTLYIINDGKPGHLAQSRGLAEAIMRLTPARTLLIDAKGRRDAPQPEQGAGLILAAGRGTHSMAMSLRKYLGVPAVALMNPSWLGRQRFDLSVIPKHDGIKPSASVIVTDGAVNPIMPASDASLTQGLLLIGGPSKHSRWDEPSIDQQIAAIFESDPAMHWTATGSRRTPASTDRMLHAFAQRHSDRFNYIPSSQTPGGWVADQLKRCGTCWVSEDSVSMVYEALTAGAQVGLIQVLSKGRPSRVAKGVQSLVERGWVTRFDQWQAGQHLVCDRPPLAEADRVAELILQRWPKLHAASQA